MMKNNIKSIDFSHAINATSAFLTISVMVLSYSITKGIGIGLLSYTIMSALAYLVELIVASVKKTEKPTWNVSIVAIVVSALFAVYFFVPTTL
jgi:xanthine/uracil/vitamin C permease (AzgA family)